MQKKIALAALLVFISSAAAFAQASALRDYVGIIGGSFHPDALAYFDKIKENLKSKGRTDAVKGIDTYLKMGFGTGFVYVTPDGNNYIITNYHVVAQTSTLSISFEKLDGAKTTYDRLKVVAADEDIDIAILTFADGGRPFKSGLSFVAKPTDEGADVFAAGFPGLGSEQIWQFSKGVISNGRVRLPHDENQAFVNEARFGPFIQHTSPIDPGNSGGPLLAAQAGATSGYAVAGINTLSATRRQSTFYAIPAERAVKYLTEAVKPKSEASLRRDLDLRLDTFLKQIAAPKAVYGIIGNYISNSCAASNAEYGILETFSRAPRTVQDAIYNEDDPLDIMKYSVGWIIEDSFRGKSTGALHASLGEITKNTDGTYTVPLKFPAHTITSTWALEFGIWKLATAGEKASGDKTLVTKKEEQQKRDKTKNDLSSYFMLSIGYTDIFDAFVRQETVYDGDSYEGRSEPVTKITPAFDVTLYIANEKLLYNVTFFVAKNFYEVGAGIGFNIPIDIKTVILAPYAVAGVNIQLFTIGEFLPVIKFGTQVEAGLMLTTTFVPGLYLLGGYQYNIPLRDFFASTTPTNTHMLKFNVGYAFY
ncbi:MAG: hypothetical protein Ta2G_01720 [Termitinemataceae bacterium]|nr:MAG: hypothetical protein Ta2G_01720 [Termitinemataceae bacterium]